MEEHLDRHGGRPAFFQQQWGIMYTDNLGNTTTNNGIGLSLLRNQIVPANSTSAGEIPTTVEMSIMQMAQARGARVWSAPWSPAAGFKDSNVVTGGNFIGNATNYQNYAAQLANYVLTMKLQGINLYAVSIQNEPDGNHPYVSPSNPRLRILRLDPAADSRFCLLYNALLQAGVASSTKIMLPESQNWTDPQGLAALAMNDPNVAADVGIIANHDYVVNNTVGDTASPAAIAAYGKALWETEVSILTGSDPSITNALYWAERIHLFLTVAQVNAYHYWWLIDVVGPGNEGLLDNNASITKRFFVFGQFSRFIRPGYVRVNVTGNTGGALISAYKDPMSGNFVIVAINNTQAPILESFTVPDFSNTNVTPSGFLRFAMYSPVSVAPWETSNSFSLASQAAVPIKNSSFSYTLPAMSVVTFEGKSFLIEIGGTLPRP